MTRFGSFLMGGFECSMLRLPDGRRRDLLAETGHDRLAFEDYAALADLGIRGARDGLRWSLIDAGAGHYDWTSAERQADAAKQFGVQVVWDLCHYDCPEDLDLWSDDFPRRFAAYCAAAIEFIVGRTPPPHAVCPVNEMSYWAWAGGRSGLFHPSRIDCAPALKRQLALAFIEGARAIRSIAPDAAIVTAEPLIHVRSTAATSGEGFHAAQFEAADMVLGLAAPELGGEMSLVDTIGVNFYPHNQWYIDGPTIPFGHQHYEALSGMLEDVWRRYGKPLFIAETAAHGSTKVAWLRWIVEQVMVSRRAGVPVEAICLYPVVSFRDWFTGELHDSGLWSEPGDAKLRPCDSALRDCMLRLLNGDQEEVSAPT
jgi:hypothetical protein